MSSSSYVKKEIARHNSLASDIRESIKLPKTQNSFSGKRENRSYGHLKSMSPPDINNVSLARTCQTPPRTEAPPLKPPKPPLLPRPSAKQNTSLLESTPSQDRVLNVSNYKKVPLPSVPAGLPPQQPKPSILSPSSQSFPKRTPQDLIPLKINEGNVAKKHVPPLPKSHSNLPPRSPNRPPPPPTLPLPTPSSGLKPQKACNFPEPTKAEHQPEDTTTTAVTLRSNTFRNRLAEVLVNRPTTSSVPSSFEEPRPLPSAEPESPVGMPAKAPFVVNNFDPDESGSSFEEIGEDSDRYDTADEFEIESDSSHGRSPSSYQVHNAAEHIEASPLQLQVDDSEEDWDENDSDDEYKKMDSDDALEVEIRHKQGSHGLVTKALDDAIAISTAMKYVSGFYDLPVLEDTYEEIGNDVHHTTATELTEAEEGSKVLWKDLPVVKSNPIFKKMDGRKRKLYETIFEIMTTEALYIRLLNSFEDQQSYFPTEEVMLTSDRDMLFSRLLLVKQCAESFYDELQRCWQKSIFLDGIFEIIEKHVSNNFSVYVNYCTNKSRIDKLFNKAKAASGVLSLQLKAFQSFLMLPMQRITRLPSLLESILQLMSATDRDYPACNRALIAVRKKAVECNQDVQSGDRMTGFLELVTRFVFPDDVPPFPLLSASRWLKLRTQATLRWRQDGEDTKDTSKDDLELFLFNDVFFICSLQGRDNSYLVQSYCRYSLVEITKVQAEFLPTLPKKYASDSPGNFVFVVDILSNHNERREIMVMSTKKREERDSWLEAAPPPPIPDMSSDICYEPWDCPVVVAMLPFEAATPYQLSLALNDKMHVTKRKTIGWYEGERLSDRKTGFFPVNYTMELDSPHKRAREIREMMFE